MPNSWTVLKHSCNISILNLWKLWESKDPVISVLSTNDAMNSAVLEKKLIAVIILLGFRYFSIWYYSSLDLSASMVGIWTIYELDNGIKRVVVFTKSFYKSVDIILVLRGIGLSFSAFTGACETWLSSFDIVIQIEDWKYPLRISKLIKTSYVDVTMKRIKKGSKKKETLCLLAQLDNSSSSVF